MLLRTTLSFTLASDTDVEPLDSAAAVAAKREGRLKLGSARKDRFRFTIEALGGLYILVTAQASEPQA